MSETPSLHVFVDSYGIDAVIASDVEDAWAVWEEETGGMRDPQITWEQQPDDNLFVLGYEDMNEVPPGEPAVEEKTCAEWATLQGRSFLGTRD